MRYSDLDKAALLAELARVQQDYEALRGHKLNLNLTRGKPETAQTALSDAMLHALDDGNFVSDGVDARNYGELAGLPACRKLFSEILFFHDSFQTLETRDGSLEHFTYR